MKFTKAVDAVAKSNLTLSKGSVDTIQLSADKKTATIAVSGLNYGDSVDVKVSGVKAGEETVPDKSVTVKVPLINEIYELSINSDDADNVILADGATKVMLTATLKEKKTGNVADVDGVVKFQATKGGIAQDEVTLENGKASVQLTSAASDSSIVSFINVVVVDAPAAKEYEGLTGSFQVTFSPEPPDQGTKDFVTALKAESNQADRFFVTFSDKISAAEYKAAVLDKDYKGDVFGINVDGVQVAVKDVLQKSDNVLEFILDTDSLGSLVPDSNRISRAVMRDLTAPNYLQDNETHILTFPENVGELVLADTKGIQFIVTDALRPFIYGVEPKDQLEFKVKFSESIAEDLAEGANLAVNGKFLIDGKKVRLFEGVKPTPTDIADAKKNNEVIVTNLSVGYYDAVTGVDTRNYVNFKMHPEFKLSAGTHQIQIANVGDWAALVDNNNKVTTQTFDFTVSVNDGKPVPTVTVQSPEQWLISFNTGVESVEDKVVEDAFKIYKADDSSAPFVYGTEYVITPVDEEGHAITAPIGAGEPVPYADKYLVEFKQDWTEYYKTDGTKDNYFTSTKNPYKLVINHLQNSLYNPMTEANLGVTLNYDGVSPTIASAVDVGTLTGKVANGHVVSDNGQAVFVQMSEPVQITGTGNTLPLTPSQDQAKGTGIPQPTFEFVKGDKVVLGTVAPGSVYEDDKDFVVIPQTSLEAGEWTLYIRSISDDVGNTSATVNTKVLVPGTVDPETDTRIAWAAFDNGDDKYDYLYIKFTKEMESSGAAGVSRTTNYIFNGVQLPTGSQVESGIKNVTNDWDGVTIQMPKGAFDGANDGEVDFRSVLNVANNFKSADGEALSGPYEVQLEDTASDEFGDKNMVFEAVYHNLSASALVDGAAVLGSVAFDEDANGKIDTVLLGLDQNVTLTTTDEIKVNGKTFHYTTGGSQTAVFKATGSSEVIGTATNDLRVTSFDGAIIINEGHVIDEAAPVVTEMKGSAGSKDVILTFSESIRAKAGTGELTVADFNYLDDAKGTGAKINGPIVSVAKNKGKVKSLEVTVNTALEAADLKNDFAELVNTVVDLENNEAKGAPAPANNAPTVENRISDKVGVLGRDKVTVNIADVFEDADNDTLTYTVDSDDTSIATVNLAASGTELEITSVAKGTATITVTANDGKGGSVKDAFNIEVVENTAPVAKTGIDQNATAGGSTVILTADDLATDAEGDSLTLTGTPASSDPAVATAAFNGSILEITPLVAGTTTVTVDVTDGEETTTVTFTVTVS